MKIRYEIISRGTMIIYVDDKKISTTGELTFTPPVFYANIDSIKYWDTPNGNMEITKEEIENIILMVTEISKKEGTKIIFY